MATLFFDGSTATTLVGLTSPSLCRFLPGKASSDGLLFTAIEELLEEAKLCKTSLLSIATGSGPGSHTGTRAVAAAAKGLAMGLNIPLRLFPSPLLLLPQKQGKVATSLPTRAEKHYFFLYNTSSKKIEFSGTLSTEEFQQESAKADHFGHDFSPYHLASFLENREPASLAEPLIYF